MTLTEGRESPDDMTPENRQEWMERADLAAAVEAGLGEGRIDTVDAVEVDQFVIVYGRKVSERPREFYMDCFTHAGNPLTMSESYTWPGLVFWTKKTRTQRRGIENYWQRAFIAQKGNRQRAQELELELEKALDEKADSIKIYQEGIGDSTIRYGHKLRPINFKGNGQFIESNSGRGLLLEAAKCGADAIIHYQGHISRGGELHRGTPVKIDPTAQKE